MGVVSHFNLTVHQSLPRFEIIAATADLSADSGRDCISVGRTAGLDTPMNANELGDRSRAK